MKSGQMPREVGRGQGMVKRSNRTAIIKGGSIGGARVKLEASRISVLEAMVLSIVLEAA
jgi:hypothetical protein